MNRPPKVLLAAMPWKHAQSPSIQLGTLHAVLERHGVPVVSRHFFLEFIEFILEQEQASEAQTDSLIVSYSDICEGSFKSGVGDFIFSGPPLREITPEIEKAFYDFLGDGNIRAQIPAAERMRKHVPAFMERCVREILDSGADVVGFTTTFNQTIPSLNLAARLKAAKPELIIMFGGANCDGPMGPALHRNYRFIDYVARGEGEYVLPRLIDCIAAGSGFDAVPGLVHRSPDGTSIVNEHGASAQVNMDDVPMPNYDSYFTLLKGARTRRLLDQNITMMVESARGCWWGEKNHCTFCGLNGLTMAFRSKKPEVFAEEIDALSRRYHRLQFFSVDNIIDYRYFATFLPLIKEKRDAGIDYDLFYETKANLKKAQVAMFQAAGVRTIQPGIESLSTPILKLMNKGTTGLQNIRLVKWAAEYGIDVTWNIICGFPGEPREEYDRMIALLPSLAHLSAPNATKLLLERFSPYFDDPAAYGIEVLGPARYYGHVYALDQQELMDIAYEFEHRCEPGEPTAVAERMRDAIEKIWPNRLPAGRLTYERGPDFVTITDTRFSLHQTLTLRGRSAAIYLACDAGASLAELRKLCGRALADVADEQIAALLQDLVNRRLMYEENGRYLSLALALRPVLHYAGNVRAAEAAELEASA